MKSKTLRKCLIVGDPQLPSKYIYKVMEEKLKKYEFDFVCKDWMKNVPLDEFALKVLMIEKEGPNIFRLQEDIMNEAANSEILIVHYMPVTNELLEISNKLRIIGCVRGGIDNIDVETAQKKGIKILSALGRNAEAVADLTIGLIIALTRDIIKLYTQLKKGNWIALKPEELPHDLRYMTLGLVGFGRVGREVAKRGRAFGMRILVYDPYVSAEDITAIGCEKCDLNTLLKEADIISIHARLTPETFHLIGEKELNIMKPDAYIVNTARADIIDGEALRKALTEKRIKGAALDVFEKEPIERNDPLLQLDNVILTPHIAGFTFEGQILNGPKIIADQLEKILMTEKAD